MLRSVTYTSLWSRRKVGDIVWVYYALRRKCFLADLFSKVRVCALKKGHKALPCVVESYSLFLWGRCRWCRILLFHSFLLAFSTLPSFEDAGDLIPSVCRFDYSLECFQDLRYFSLRYFTAFLALSLSSMGFLGFSFCWFAGDPEPTGVDANHEKDCFTLGTACCPSLV